MAFTPHLFREGRRFYLSQWQLALRVRIHSVLTSWRFITFIPRREDSVLCISPHSGDNFEKWIELPLPLVESSFTHPTQKYEFLTPEAYIPAYLNLYIGQACLVGACVGWTLIALYFINTTLLYLRACSIHLFTKLYLLLQPTFVNAWSATTCFSQEKEDRHGMLWTPYLTLVSKLFTHLKTYTCPY